MKLRVLEPAERDRTVKEWFDTVGAAGMSAKMLVGAGEDAYEGKKGPGELLEMALAKLAGVKSRRYEGELGDAVDLILKAKEWIDGHLVREASQ